MIVDDINQLCQKYQPLVDAEKTQHGKEAVLRQFKDELWLLVGNPKLIKGGLHWETVFCDFRTSAAVAPNGMYMHMEIINNA